MEDARTVRPYEGGSDFKNMGEKLHCSIFEFSLQ